MAGGPPLVRCVACSPKSRRSMTRGKPRCCWDSAFSPARGVVRYWRGGRGGVAAREAAAVSIGRHADDTKDAVDCLARALRGEPDGAGRGAAAVSWLLPGQQNPQLNDGLAPP